MKQQWKNHKPLLAALATLAVLLAGVVLIWLAQVRPNVGKGRSEIITDFLRAELIHDGETAEQVFTYDKDILTIGLEFYLTGAQPSGELDVVLYDADTGEELARSVGTMDYIVPDQYTTLGLDPAVTGQEGRRYRLTVTPHYTTDAILAVGHSDGVALWKEQMSVADRAVDGTMAMQITYQRIGGYLTRFFLVVGGFAALLAAFAVWAVLSKKLALHRLVFVLVLGLGLLYSFVLPPYAAPDEKYHINQSFTLACRWANDLSRDEWRMGKVPTTTSFRRVGDEDADLQDENTTVFTWEEFTSELFTMTDQPFDSHQEYNELQTDQNPLLYVVSAAAVFLAYVLHLGFAPALFLGRLANLLLFAALAALAVKVAPFGKRVFTVAALLPMTLHLAASFSRDAPLLGLCFAFTALLLDAAFGPEKQKALSPARLALLLGCGVLLAPGKLVYLPLAALLLVVPAARLGRHAKAKKCGYLAICLALALLLNTGLLADTLHSGAGEQTETSETTETTAEAANIEDTDRTPKGRPEERDADYEVEICTVNTTENFLRRLYYFIDNTRIPPKANWTSGCRLSMTVMLPLLCWSRASSFRRSISMNTMIAPTFIGMCAAPYWAPMSAMATRMPSTPTLNRAARCWPISSCWGWTAPRLTLQSWGWKSAQWMTASRWTAPNWQKRSRPPARPAVPRARRMRPTRLPIRPGTSCDIPWPLSCCLCAAPWKTATTISARWWAAV